MTIELNKIEKISSWNRTYENKGYILYPNNIDELKKIFKLLKKKKLNYVIKTGECSYDDKSINYNKQTIIISLIKLSKLKKIKNNQLTVGCGALIADVLKIIKEKNYSLYSIPGGQKISIGGAISANVIGKDSSKQFASFGDSIKELKILSNKGKIYNPKKDFVKYVGAFGMNGLILESTLKLKNNISSNLIVKSKILNNINQIIKFLDYKKEYAYVQLDPFFRKKNFALAIEGNISKINSKIYKNVNLNYNFFDKIIFKFLSNFINPFTWRIFYFLYFYFAIKFKNRLIDVHNFHYESKYKHLIPLLSKKGLIDFEIMILNKTKFIIQKLIIFLKSNKLCPFYVILKKTFKSKKKYTYSFNQNGYSLSFSLDKKYLSEKVLKKLYYFLEKNKLKINYSKSDKYYLKRYDKENYLFMSLYKQKLKMEANEISR